ncbi:MAG: outer membrane beta-barrel protein [Burkholderiales bacterium]
MNLIRNTLLLMTGLVCLLPQVAGAQAGERQAGRWYIGGALGGFAEEDNSQITGQDAEFATFFSGGYRASPNVAVEATAMHWGQDFATPTGILPGAEARTDLYTFGVGGQVKFFVPLDSMDLFAGAGLGLYTTNLKVKGSSSEIDENDTDLGIQGLLGVDVFVSNRISVGLEYRWLRLDANFEPQISGDIDVGGHFFFATVRGYF